MKIILGHHHMGNDDYASGSTPEMAMRSVLRNHPAFDEPLEVTYYSEEPAFMQVTLADIPDFGWEQYNNDANELRPGGQPNVYVSERADTTKFHIDNVWITTDKTHDGEPCHVKFRFIAELETAFVEGGKLFDKNVDSSTVWSAERVSTEPAAS